MRSCLTDLHGFRTPATTVAFAVLPWLCLGRPRPGVQDGSPSGPPAAPRSGVVGNLIDSDIRHLHYLGEEADLRLAEGSKLLHGVGPGEGAEAGQPLRRARVADHLVQLRVEPADQPRIGAGGDEDAVPLPGLEAG